MHIAATTRLDSVPNPHSQARTMEGITRGEGPSLGPTEQELSSGAASATGLSRSDVVRAERPASPVGQQVDQSDALMRDIRKVHTLEAFEQAREGIGGLRDCFQGEALYALGCRIVHLQEPAGPGTIGGAGFPSVQEIAEAQLSDAMHLHLPAASDHSLCRKLVTHMEEIRDLGRRLRQAGNLAEFRAALLDAPGSEVSAVRDYDEPRLRNELLVLAGRNIPDLPADARRHARQLLCDISRTLGDKLGTDLRDMLQALPLALQVVADLESARTWHDLIGAVGSKGNWEGDGYSTIKSLRADLRAVALRIAVYEFRAMSVSGPVDKVLEPFAWGRLETAVSDPTVHEHDASLLEDCHSNRREGFRSRTLAALEGD